MNEPIVLSNKDGELVDDKGNHYVCVEKLGENSQFILKAGFGSSTDQNGDEWFHEDEVDGIKDDVERECRNEWESEVGYFQNELRVVRDVILDAPELRDAIEAMEPLDKAKVERALGLRPA